MKRSLLLTITALCALTLTARGQDSLTRGKELLGQDKAPEAIVQLLPVAQTDLRNAEARLLLAEAYFEVGKPDSAEVMSRSYLALNKKNPDAYVWLARAAVKQKKFSEAYDTLKKSPKSVRNHPSVLCELGFVHLAADSVDQAMVSFSQAKTIDPKNALAAKGIGEAYLRLNATALAVLSLEEAVREDSSLVDAKYMLAKQYFKDRRFNEAAEMFSDVLQMNPGDEVAALELGQLYFLARQFRNAIKILGPYLERNPDNLDARTMYAEALKQTRQYDAALAAAERVLESRPSRAQAAAAHRVAGRSQYVLKNYDGAIVHYRALSDIDSLSAEDARYFGKAYYDTGKDSLATVHLEQALARGSTESDLFAELGAAFMRRKDFGKAAGYYERKIAQDSTATSAYVNYALCMEVLQQWEKGRGALVKVLEQNPGYAPAYYHLGYCLSQMDSLPSARRAYENFVAVTDTASSRQNGSGDLYNAYRFIAVVYLSEKQFAQAEGPLAKAVSIKPADVELRLWYAQTLHALNKRAEAQREYQRVLKLDPGNKDAKKGLDILELYQ